MAAAGGGHPSPGPGQGLTALSLTTCQLGQGRLRAGLSGLSLQAGTGGLGQQLARLVNSGPGLVLGGGRLLGPALQLLGVGALGGAGCGRQAPQALSGHLLQGAQGLLGRGELLPGAAGLPQALPGTGLGRGELLQAGAGGLLGLLQGGTTSFQGGGVRLPGSQEGLGLDDVVGQEAGGGVTDLGLDGAGPPGDGGLPGQGAELAVELSGQVGQAREVGGHGVELAQGALLASPVLEDARGLLDKAATVLGGGAQDGVEPALAHHGVHLAAQARVAQQLGDVQEAHGGAVDLVLAAPAPEEGAGDGDLGVVNGQGAVGVVNGQGDLGASERRAGAGPGEDDVGHGAAAQVLGPLLPHDPGQGVHHIGLAAPVGPHHGGDTGLQAQGG